MAIRFVTQETVRLPLSGDDYIVIKRRLSHGERDDMMGLLVPSLTPGQPMHVEAKEIRTGKVLAYLLAWSSPEPIDRDTIRSLDADQFDEIEHAIDAHLATETAASKNASAASAPISVSVG
jgi:hypothetical protein